ncbi:MAG: hypothetical protein IKD46_06935 [Lentisphaeria bacterium]|nr:hypothetical protein [Lentisphaeria bacterium]
MKSSKYLLLLACAMLGTGLYAEEEAKAPARPEKAPHARRMQRPDMAKMFLLNDAEKKIVADADTAYQEAMKKIREQAIAEAKKSAAAQFDAKLKVYKEATARITDEKAQKRAEKILERMEANRERLIERSARMTIGPGRNKAFGRRPGGPEGRPMMGPPSQPAAAPAAQ